MTMIGEHPIHPAFTDLRVGQWIEFSTPNFHRVGKILAKSGRSLEVLYQGFSEPTALPDAEIYFWDADDPHRMTRIKVVPPQQRIPAPSGLATVAQAAAILGTTNKGVRQMLRDGSLKGKQKGNKWHSVILP